MHERRMISVLLVAAGLAAAAAHAHSPGKGGAVPASSQTPAAAPAPSGKGTRDPRAYFTDLELLTQDGRKVRFFSDMLAERTVLINVIYTTCKDACPLITRKLVEVRSLVGERFGKDVYFISLSSDPANDTPKALRDFAREQGVDLSGWTLLTGNPKNVAHILKKLGQYSADPQDHSTLLIAGNVGAGRWSKIRPDAPPIAIAERLKVLADSGRPGAPAAR